MPIEDAELRTQLVGALRQSNAHVDLLTALKDFPENLYGAKSKSAPYTAWQLLEHIRIALNDLLVFSTNPNYTDLEFPDDYWPKQEAPASAAAWKRSVQAIRADLDAFEQLIQNPESNLYARIPWGDGQTLLREVLVAIDHNSYHVGQFVMLRKELGAWES